jgi:homoserine kinase type II
MGTFRTLTRDDVREILDGYGLGDYRAHAPIPVGTINTNVAVELADRRLFLRVNEGKSPGDVEREAGIVLHAAARGVPTPVPLTSAAGAPYLPWQGTFVSLFPWLEGGTLGRFDVTPEHARQAGAALARLHLAGANLPDHRPGRYEPDEIARRFERIGRDAGRDAELADAIRILGPELEALERERRGDVPLGLIHGDLFIDNVLYGRDGRLVALLDFEQASWGRLAYDLAVSALAFGFGRNDFRADVTRAFLDGYASARPPTDGEREAFAAELRFACCRFAVTRITDVHMRRGQGAPGGKDFRRYLQRLAAVRVHVEARDGLLALP